jgi:hypothetical protein
VHRPAPRRAGRRRRAGRLVRVVRPQIEIEAIVNNAVTRLGQRALGENLASGEITDVSKLIGG